MARILFTMLPANDLGLPTRLVPIARVLADRGHDVAVCNPACAPSRLIEDAGLRNLPMPEHSWLPASPDLVQVATAWDVEHFFGALFSDEAFVRTTMALHVATMRDYSPDIVVDSFGPFGCLASRILHIPLVSVLQGNFHPDSAGFVWWAGARPDGLPSAAAAFSAVATENGASPVNRVVDLLAGELSLIVGTPETDPVSATADVTHVGPILWQRSDAVLPDWVARLNHDQPLVWVYSGTPRYADVPVPGDSIVVIRAAIAALRDAPVHVVLTTGYQLVPEEIGPLPGNFHHAAYLPGPAMAARCDAIVFHGGHSSVMTALSAGTPSVIIPTITERESNARRVAALGAGEVVMPTDGADGEKYVDVAGFNAKLQRVLNNLSYRDAAQRVATSMRQFGGALEAADRIEAFAKSRIDGVRRKNTSRQSLV